MKQEVKPKIAIVIIAAVVVLVGAAIYFRSNIAPSGTGENRQSEDSGKRMMEMMNKMQSGGGSAPSGGPRMPGQPGGPPMMPGQPGR